MSENRIEVGDMVHVDFNCAKFTLCSRAEVLNIPQATGDSWIFKGKLDDKLYYVSEGCTITKLDD